MPPIPRPKNLLKQKYGALSKAQAIQVAKIANRQIQKKADHKQYVQYIAATPFAHQDTYVINPFFGIPEGTGPNERIGSEINVSGILMNLKIRGSHGDNVMCRIRVWTEMEDTFVTHSSYTTVSQATATTAGFVANSEDMMTVPNDKFTVKVLKDDVITLNENYTGDQVMYFKRIWIPIKKKYVYTAAGFSKYQNYYVSISMNSPGATAGTTVIGYVTNHYSIYFTD